MFFPCEQKRAAGAFPSLPPALFPSRGRTRYSWGPQRGELTDLHLCSCVLALTTPFCRLFLQGLLES